MYLNKYNNKYNFRVFINVRKSMVLEILSTTCTNRNTFTEEREAAIYICKYIININVFL